jgi:hypothetical protein
LNLSKFVSVQAYYTIAGRDLERELVPMIRDQKLGLMVWSPLAGGLLSGKFSSAEDKGPAGARRAAFDFPLVDKPRAFRCVDAMRPMAGARKISVAQIALAWLLAKPFVTSVIIGAKSMDQLRDNIDSTRVQLDEAEIKQLDEISALPAEYPAWMLAYQGHAIIPIGCFQTRRARGGAHRRARSPHRLCDIGRTGSHGADRRRTGARIDQILAGSRELSRARNPIAVGNDDARVRHP